jgi:thioredoxin reductase (NADPH)
MDHTGPKVQLFGTRGSAEAHAIRDFLYRSGVPFRWIELSSDDQARTEAQVGDLNDQRLPVCVFADGTRMDARPFGRSPRSWGGSKIPPDRNTTLRSMAPARPGSALRSMALRKA